LYIELFMFSQFIKETTMNRCSIYFLTVFLWKKVIKEIEAIFSISGLTAKYRNQGIISVTSEA
jgi:hypothetical protein